MTIWVDAQLSPSLAPGIEGQFGLTAYSVEYLGHRDASDEEIFEKAREAGAIVMTKDDDFVRLLEQKGPPPQVLWITLGNTSNARLREILERRLPEAITLLENKESLVEIAEPTS